MSHPLRAPREPQDPPHTYIGDWMLWTYNYDEAGRDGVTEWESRTVVPDIVYVLDPEPGEYDTRLYVFRGHQGVMRVEALSTHRYAMGEDRPEGGPRCCGLALFEGSPVWPDDAEQVEWLRPLEHGDFPDEVVAAVMKVTDAPVFTVPDPDDEGGDEQ